MKDWKDWSQERPARDTWVWMKFSLEDEWRLVKTCKRGCCVYSELGTLILPNFWKPATDAEGATEQASWDAMPEIDMWDLIR